ncbi:MAG: DUF4234 domain-containing protein [Oscillospiraceae bacterium]
MISQKSLLKFILLSAVTFGIYGIYTLYKFNEDNNVLCNGDGKNNQNYIIVLIMSSFTCGIYGLYWYYTQGERLYNAAPRYGLSFQEKGSNVILWLTLGSLILVGPFIALNTLFKNQNQLATIYNSRIANNGGFDPNQQQQGGYYDPNQQQGGYYDPNQQQGGYYDPNQNNNYPPQQ